MEQIGIVPRALDEHLIEPVPNTNGAPLVARVEAHNLADARRLIALELIVPILFVVIGLARDLDRQMRRAPLELQGPIEPGALLHVPVGLGHLLLRREIESAQRFFAATPESQRPWTQRASEAPSGSPPNLGTGC